MYSSFVSRIGEKAQQHDKDNMAKTTYTKTDCCLYRTLGCNQCHFVQKKNDREAFVNSTMTAISLTVCFFPLLVIDTSIYTPRIIGTRNLLIQTKQSRTIIMCKFCQYVFSDCNHPATAPFCYEVCDELCEAKLQSQRRGLIGARHYWPYRTTAETQRLDIEMIYIDSSCRICAADEGRKFNPYSGHDPLFERHQTIFSHANWEVPEYAEHFPFDGRIPEDRRETYSWVDQPRQRRNSRGTYSSSSSGVSPHTIRARRPRRTNSPDDQHTQDQSHEGQSPDPSSLDDQAQPSRTNSEGSHQDLDSRVSNESSDADLARALREAAADSISPLPRTTHMPRLSADLPETEALPALVPQRLNPRIRLSQRTGPIPQRLERMPWQSTTPPGSPPRPSVGSNRANAGTSSPHPRHLPDVDPSLIPLPLSPKRNPSPTGSNTSSVTGTARRIPGFYISTSTQTDDFTPEQAENPRRASPTAPASIADSSASIDSDTNTETDSEGDEEYQAPQPGVLRSIKAHVRANRNEPVTHFQECMPCASVLAGVYFGTVAVVVALQSKR